MIPIPPAAALPRSRRQLLFNPKVGWETRNQLRRSHLVLSRMFRILINESRLRDVSKEEGRRIGWEPGNDVFGVQERRLLRK